MVSAPVVSVREAMIPWFGRGYIDVGSLVINSLQNDNAYRVLVSFHVNATISSSGLSCFPDSQTNGDQFDVKDFEVLLVKRGSFANLHEPKHSVNQLLSSEDKLKKAIGLEVNILSPGANVFFKRWV